MSKSRCTHWTAIKQWLRVKGFHIGQTSTGWVAVNRTGIVIVASPARVKAEWVGPNFAAEQRKVADADLKWMQVTVSQAERDAELRADEARAMNVQFRCTDGEGEAIRKAMYEGEG